MNESYQIILELTKVLSNTKNKQDRAYIRGLIDNVWSKDLKEEKKSRIDDIEAKLDSLITKTTFT